MGNPMDFERHHLGGFPLPGLAQEIEHEDSPGRPLRELSESGLLWLINATVFHPRGFALALSMDTTTGEVTGWDIVGHGQSPWRYAGDMDDRFDAAEATLASYRNLLPCGCPRIGDDGHQEGPGCPAYTGPKDRQPDWPGQEAASNG